MGSVIESHYNLITWGTWNNSRRANEEDEIDALSTSTFYAGGFLAEAVAHLGFLSESSLILVA